MPNNNEPGCSDGQGFSDQMPVYDVEAFQEYQLATQIKLDGIESWEKVIENLSEKDFETLLSYVEDNISFYYFCAVLSTWLPLDAFNKELADIVADMDRAQSEQSHNDLWSEQQMDRHLAYLNSIKDKLKCFNHDLVTYELKFCNGNFFKADQYIDGKGKLHVNKERFPDKIVRLGPSEIYDNNQLGQRYKRFYQALQMYPDDYPVRWPKSYLDLCCSYIKKIIQFKQAYPLGFASIQSYPFLVEQRGDMHINFPKSPPILTPSMKCLNIFYDSASRGLGHLSSEIATKQIYNAMATELLCMLRKQRINQECIEAVHGRGFNIERRWRYAPSKLLHYINKLEKDCNQRKQQLNDDIDQMSDLLMQCFYFLRYYPIQRQRLMNVASQQIAWFVPDASKAFNSTKQVNQFGRRLNDACRSIDNPRSRYSLTDIRFFDRTYYQSEQFLSQTLSCSLPTDMPSGQRSDGSEEWAYRQMGKVLTKQ